MPPPFRRRVFFWVVGALATSDFGKNGALGQQETSNNPTSGSPCGQSLVCRNGGTCSEGDSVWPGPEEGLPEELAETNQEGFFCQCPDGVTGLSCEIPYVQCEYPAGFTVCYHGGSCLEVPPVEWSEMVPVCNCQTAKHKGEVYVGRNCEALAHAADPCADLEVPCYNGGVCIQDSRGAFCRCAPGFEGDVCDVVTSAIATTTAPSPPPPAAKRASDNNNECDLFCENGGTCRQQVESSTTQPLWGTADGGKYCECAAGFAGVQCEHVAQICGDNEHVCLHGSTCEPKDEGGFDCACPTTNYQGGSCREQNKVTYCNPSATSSDAYEYAFGMAVPAFCVNGGQCRDEVTRSQVFSGCDCPPLFVGPHCEFPVADGARIVTPRTPREDESNGRSVVDFVLLFFVVVILGAVGQKVTHVLTERQRQRDSVTNLQSFREENQGAMAASGSMLFPSMAPQHQHGNFTIGELLHDVEIS